MIEIQLYTVTSLSTNCYLLTDKETGEMAVVDPGDKSDELIEEIKSKGNKLMYIMLTHGHYDHIGFADELAKMFDAKIVCSTNTDKFLSDNMLNHSMYHDDIPNIKPFKADVLLSDNDVFNLGSTPISFITTPGHTDGCGCYLFDNSMISGDTLFCETFGRTDLPTGSLGMMISTFRKLKAIEQNYTVYPGHGPFTTLDHERKYNPLMRRF